VLWRWGIDKGRIGGGGGGCKSHASDWGSIGVCVCVCVCGLGLGGGRR